MNYKQSLREGIKVESEHYDVMKFLRKYLKKHKKLPPNQKVYEAISKSHLKEDSKYYLKLKKAKL